MKLRIITDQEYVTVPIEELHLIQKVLDASSLLALALSRCDIKDELSNHYLEKLIKQNDELYEYLIERNASKEKKVVQEKMNEIVTEKTSESSNVISLFPKKHD